MLLQPEELRSRQKELKSTLVRGEFKAAAKVAQNISPTRVASLLAEAPAGATEGLLGVMSRERAVEILEVLSPHHAAQVLRVLDAEKAARLFSALPADRAADLLAVVQQDVRVRLLESLSPKRRALVQGLSRYAPGSAGGVMKPHFLAIGKGSTVGDTLDAVLAATPGLERSSYVFVTDAGGKLEGVISLKDLVRLDPKIPVEQVMVHPVIAVTVDTPAREAAVHLRNRRFTMLPVVDTHQVLVGVIAFEDAMDLLAEDLAQRFTGIGGGTVEETFHTPAMGAVRRRLPWMAGNVFLNLGAVAVIAGFADTIAAVVILAAFLPMITDMGGNVGIQALSVAIRSIALGEARLGDVWRSTRKEFFIGLVNGAVLGALFSVIAFLIGGNPWIGLIAGVALGVNVLIAGIVGGTLPFLLKRWGKDPAMMTGPVLTTITDITGVAIFLGLATMFLGYLIV